MPSPSTLADEIADLHADAVEAARVSRLCQVAAGQRLEEIRDGMRMLDWTKWVRSPECPVSPQLVARYLEAADEATQAG
jgi:hypothetical protein